MGPRQSDGPAPLARIGALEYRRDEQISAEVRNASQQRSSPHLGNSKAMITNNLLSSVPEYQCRYEVLRTLPYLSFYFRPSASRCTGHYRVGYTRWPVWSLAAAGWAFTPWHTRDGAYIDRST